MVSQVKCDECGAYYHFSGGSRSVTYCPACGRELNEPHRFGFK